MSNELPYLRLSSGWVDPPLFPKNIVKTPIDVTDELWGRIRSFSEVQSRGIDLAARHNVEESLRENVWKSFRAYIRQADNYWASASRTNYKSSSLLYYYSFLNLVNAFLILKKPELRRKRILHGLSFDTSTRRKVLNSQVVRVDNPRSQNAVSAFSLFYNEILHTAPPAEFNVLNLFSYTVDIGYQYYEGGFGRLRCWPLIHRINMDKSRNKYWSTVAVHQFANLSYIQSIFSQFHEDFELTQGDKLRTVDFRATYGFESNEWQSYNFYQNKPEKELDMVGGGVIYPALTERLKQALDGWLAPSYYTDNFSGYLSVPINRAKPVLVNEETSIFILMFFMSELVRYRPDYLEHVFDSRAAWLLESFVETCPLKFLRAMIYHLTKEVFAVSQF